MKNFEVCNNINIDASASTDIFDSLPVGVKAFYGSIKNGLTPIYFNKKMGELMGLTDANYKLVLSAQNNYGVHPDDVSSLFDDIAKHISSGEDFTHIHRIRFSNGEYHTGLFNISFRKHDSKNFELIFVLSVIQEDEYFKKRIDTNYETISDNLDLKKNSTRVSFCFSLTYNKCFKSDGKLPLMNDLIFDTTIDDFFESVASNISLKETRDNFTNIYSSTKLIEAFKNGNSLVEIALPLTMKSNDLLWMRFVVSIYKVENSSEIECNISIMEAFENTYLSNIVDAVFKDDIKQMAQINAYSGRMFYFVSSKDYKNTSSNIASADYNVVYKEDLKELVAPEFYDEAIHSLSLEHVKKKLSEMDKYIKVFPCFDKTTNTEKMYQWRMRYEDDSHTIITKTVIDLSKYIDDGYDILTGVLNRKGFIKMVKNELRSNPYKKYRILYYKFDGLKSLSYEKGFSYADRFLRNFLAMIKSRVSRLNLNALLGRFEEDHFVSLNPVGIQTPEEIYAELVAQIKQSVEAKTISVRIGVYDIDNHNEDPVVMCDKASLALRSTKTMTSATIGYYSPSLNDRLIEEEILASEVQNALDTEQFEVWYQPQVNHMTNLVVGAEALVRWIHPKRGLVSPGLFIPILEQNGHIYDLDKYVWEHAIIQLREWIDSGMQSLPISVNISRVDLLREDFFEVITSLTKKYDIPTSLLHLEITESAFIDGAKKIIDTVNKLIDYGYVVAIDDFGSGYSSLSMLKSVKAQILKLDLRFFDSNDDELRNKCIIESIVRMAKMLGITVIAEGVEHVEQADFLSSIGCIYIQGFLYSKALRSNDYTKFVIDYLAIQSDSSKNLEDTISIQDDDIFHKMMVASNINIIVIDKATKELLYVNRAAEMYYAKNFDPLKKQKCYDYCGKVSCLKECPLDRINNVNEEVIIVEENGRFMKNKYSSINWNGHDAYICFKTDVTKETEESKRIEQIIRNIPGSIVTFKIENNQLVKTFISDTAIKYLSLNKTITETVSTPIGCIYYEDAPKVIIAIEQAIANFNVFNEEYRIYDLNGYLIWIKLVLKPVIVNEEKLFYGLYTSINDKKKLENQLLTLVENVPGALCEFILVDHSIICTYLSEKINESLGSSIKVNDTINIDNIVSYIYHEDQQYIKKVLIDGITKNESLITSFRVERKDGSIRWIEFKTSILGDVNGNPHYYGLFSDITDNNKQNAEREKKNNIKYLILEQYENDSLVKQSENLIYKLKFDASTSEVLDSWIDEKECSTYEVSEDYMDVLTSSPLSNKDKVLLKEKFSKERFNTALQKDGYFMESVEYFRESKNGKILFVRTELKGYIDLESYGHVGFIFTYDLGKTTLPNSLLNNIISPALESIMLVNTNSGVVQGYNIVTKKSNNKKSIEYIDERSSNFAKKHIRTKQKEEFKNITSLAVIKDELKKNNGIYKTSFFSYYGSKRKRTSLEYRYLNEEGNAFIMLKNDVTDLYNEQQKSKFKLDDALDRAERMKYDTLTGLLNRGETIAEIENYLKNTTDKMYSLIMIDLDNLKYINDKYGHPEGDRALSVAAYLMKIHFPEDSVFGRIGGDEFMILLKNTLSVDIVKQYLEEYIKLANRTHINPDETLQLSCGYVLSEKGNDSFDVLYRNTDRALYHAKENGKNSFFGYQEFENLPGGGTSNSEKSN